MGDRSSSGIDIILAVLASVVFIVFHLLLDRYYRLSADDFSGIDYAMQGIPGLGYAWRFYFNWEGSFLAVLLQGLLMYCIAMGIPAVFLFALVKSAMIGAGYALLSAVSDRFRLNWTRAARLSAATASAMALYLISSEPSQIWHWAIGATYLYPIIMFQLGVTLLLRDRIFYAVVPFAFVAQSRATYAVIFFGALFLLTAYQWVSGNPKKRDWTILCTLIFIFLVTYLVAPGNFVRMKDTQFEPAHLIGQFTRGLENLFVSYNMAKLDRVFLAALAMMPLLNGFPKSLLPGKRWHWFVPAILYLVFAVTHELLFVYITGYCEWPRVLSLHSFLFLSTCLIYGLWLGERLLQHASALRRTLGYIGILGLLVYLLSDVGWQLDAAERFSMQYDRRMETILDYAGNDTLIIDPIIYDGALYFKDFSEDPDHWINKDFRKAYDLDFKVAVRGE